MRLAFSAGLLWVPQGSKSARYNVHERGGAKFCVFLSPLSSVDATTRQLATKRPGGLDACFGRLAAGSQAREQSAKADEVFGNDEVGNYVSHRRTEREDTLQPHVLPTLRLHWGVAQRKRARTATERQAKQALTFFKRTCIS